MRSGFKISFIGFTMTHSSRLTPGWRDVALLAALAALGGMAFAVALPAAVPQGEIDVSPEATPEIRQVKPSQAAVGEEVSVVIEGQNFSRGAYVAFSTPAVHVISTRRASATKLEAKVAIGKKAQPGTVSLYVSNPASSVAEVPFTIAGGAAPAAAPAPAAPTAEIQPSEPATPEVAAVEPARAARGSQASLKISGKNFVAGTKVAFANPGIRVLETQVAKASELVTRIQIAPDAPTGTSGLFVINPDDREAEAPFEVAEGGASVAPAPPATTAGPAATAAPAPEQGESLRFAVISLGDVTSILQTRNLPKGTLTVAGGELKYEEAGKEVFALPLGEIKEIDITTFVGVNTGTFHIILNSGKTYNFAAASLRPADNQAIVDSLRRALK
jgi:predicted RNA-binding protein YlxR (DUF448 family)